MDKFYRVIWPTPYLRGNFTLEVDLDRTPITLVMDTCEVSKREDTSLKSRASKRTSTPIAQTH